MASPKQNHCAVCEVGAPCSCWDTGGFGCVFSRGSPQRRKYVADIRSIGLSAAKRSWSKAKPNSLNFNKSVVFGAER